MNIVMHGALGRMGRIILALAARDSAITITGAVDALGDPAGSDIGAIIGVGTLDVPVETSLDRAIANAGVVIDFTSPDAAINAGRICADAGVPLVVGTTGFTAEQRARLVDTVAAIPCVLAPNMSVGVNLLFKIVAEAAAFLGDDYDVEITEVHHRFKKDAPSGTAARLAEIIADTLGRDLETDGVYGRKGITGERTRREIGIHALRAGDVVGEHTVTFGTIGERIELVHKAHSRDALAAGSLRAARFVQDARPGLYDMQDVLGLR